jgi:transcriptional regulator with XRE-family HTH domain
LTRKPGEARILVMEKPPSGLGRRVAKIREAAGLPARQLGLVIGASHGLVAHLESGKVADLRSTLILSMARALGTSVEYLVEGTGTEPTIEETRAAFSAAKAARASTSPAVAA